MRVGWTMEWRVRMVTMGRWWGKMITWRFDFNVVVIADRKMVVNFLSVAIFRGLAVLFNEIFYGIYCPITLQETRSKSLKRFN